eukprot:jgi/Picre1/33313/NNA_008637.t1
MSGAAAGGSPTNNILLGGKGVTHCIPLTCVSNPLPFDITHGTLSTQAIHPYSMTLNLAMVRMVAQIQQNAWRLQALCCLIPNCNYALINRDQDKKCEIDCSIYKETVTEWKCRMYFSGTDKKSDDNSFCDPAGKKRQCEKLPLWPWLTQQEFKDMQSAYYAPLSECGARRKLLATSGSITNPDDVKKSLKKFRRSTKSIRDGFRKARKEPEAKRT